ncbi:hypothetical protein [Methylopila sp. M107]|uniref:hypothetical protein n=1 Tax=Methylopila sp. M107 TaxID=1101190 RepID=UPI00037DEF7A|nr:hypothetical protein [Methylopila sp. M107]
MKTLILAAAAVLAVSTAANAQSVVKETEAGVHSSPTAGATPQAREHPSEDTTVLEKRETTTVTEPREKVVIEKAPRTTVETGGSVEAETTHGSPY